MCDCPRFLLSFLQSKSCIHSHLLIESESWLRFDDQSHKEDRKKELPLVFLGLSSSSAQSPSRTLRNNLQQQNCHRSPLGAVLPTALHFAKLCQYITSKGNQYKHKEAIMPLQICRRKYFRYASLPGPQADPESVPKALGARQENFNLKGYGSISRQYAFTLKAIQTRQS